MAAVKIKLAVDRPRSRVLFADAGSDFADLLLGFLSLPLSVLQFYAGASSSSSRSPGCLSKLCDSVNHLTESGLLNVDTCHGMLLTPTHTDRLNQVQNTESFLRGKERFVVSDDWTIKPASTSNILFLSQMFGSDGIGNGFEEIDVCVGWPEVECLLMASLSSDTIFTDAFLSKGGTSAQAAGLTVNPISSINQKSPYQCNKDSGSSLEIKIKLFYDTHEKKVMYAECNHEFVDLLLGFLACPVGRVIRDTGAGPRAASHLGRNFTNLYNSAVGLDAAGFLDRMPEFACYCCPPMLVEDRMYLVDDDLFIQQATGMSVMKHWCMRNKAKVLEMDTAIGKKEIVALLRAALTSETALTGVFMSRLEKQSSLQKMQIFAVLPDGKTITVEVATYETIAIVKSKIMDRLDITPSCRHELVHGTRYLKDPCTIAECNIVKESTVFCYFYSKGDATGSKRQRNS